MDSYTAHDGSYRKWRHADVPLSAARCYDCGIPYGEGPFGDLVLPNEVWERINPTYHRGAGLLCPSCIFERLAVIGCAVMQACIWPVVLDKENNWKVESYEVYGDAEQPERVGAGE